MHQSEAYQSLTPFERAILIELLARFNGYNNGSIVVSYRQFAAALGNSNYRKIGRAIAVLMQRGLIDISTESIWKERKSREYRLTFISTGRPPNSRAATNDYRDWRKNDADGVSAGID